MQFRNEEINCTLDNGVSLVLIDGLDRAELQADTTLFWQPFEREHWQLFDIDNVRSEIMVSQPAIGAGVVAVIFAMLLAPISGWLGIALALLGLGFALCGGIIGTMMLTIHHRDGTSSSPAPLGRPTTERFQVLDGFIGAVNAHLEARRAFEASVKRDAEEVQ